MTPPPASEAPARPVRAERFMAATSSPAATEAAAGILRAGGNAVDAAVAAAAMLAVVEPQATGIGGDCFMLIHLAGEGRTLGLNASGRAGAAASIGEIKRLGHAFMPLRGPLAVTVPGAVDGWCAALDRAGSRPFSDLLAPAVAAAREGFEVTPVVAREWADAVASGMLAAPGCQAAWTVGGRAPRAGERFRQPDLAMTLEAVAAGGRAAFYEGEIAERIAGFLAAEGGLISREDLAGQRAEWVEPLRVGYRGLDLLELPPNGQGLAALIGLGILERMAPEGRAADSADWLHLLIESVKLAYADRGAHVADPRFSTVPVDALLSPDYLAARARLVDRGRALPLASPGVLPKGTDTVILATGDAEGNLVALINSLYFPFGSGLVVEGTGITLHNRGGGFTLDEAHPNALAPRKRPFHTLVPAMLARGGAPFAAFGVMGADIQAQAHVQVVSGLVDGGLGPQAALDAPRFFFLAGNRVALEEPLFSSAGEALRALGHDVAGPAELPYPLSFGAGQMVSRDGAGGWIGASDRRKDGLALGG